MVIRAEFEHLPFHTNKPRRSRPNSDSPRFDGVLLLSVRRARAQAAGFVWSCSNPERRLCREAGVV